MSPHFSWCCTILYKTGSYHPASKGIAEHTIVVLTNTVLSMLYNSGLLEFFWAAAFSSATYIWYVYNRTWNASSITLSGVDRIAVY